MIHERTAQVGGRPVRYLEAGAGTPVVLFHAFPLSADMWRPQFERVPDGWRFLAPDLPGFGPGARAGTRSVDGMAAEVGALLDGLEVGRATIGGLSMGGYVAFALFRASPERFAGAILANTRAAADSDEGRAARDRMSALVREGGPPAVADAMLPKLLGATSQGTRPELAARVRALIERNSVEGIDAAIGAMKGRPDATPLLPRMRCPVLVVTGDEDVLIPTGESASMVRLLPAAELVTIPGAGHLSSMEAPDAFSDALAAFLHARR